MGQSLSIYSPSGQVGLPENPFGQRIANLQLYQALARHADLTRLDFLTVREITPEGLAESLFPGETPPVELGAGPILNLQPAIQAGALLRGSLTLSDLAWQRRRQAGDRAYSLIGLIHTLAPPAIRQDLVSNLAAPTQDWDAIICTSPVVRDATQALFDSWHDHLADRMGATKRPQPRLPLIPLGVDGPAMAALADRPQVRRSRREALGLEPDDVLVLWVGRLSFFEKAFPQPMFRAVEEAAARTGRKVVFAMSGWFPGGDRDREFYVSAAKAYAPSVRLELLNGNDRELLGELWAASDIFISLVDNIQETFGITPIEAMAAGLPVVVSDWDGYRYTVRDGMEGFLIPTLGGPPRVMGEHMTARHLVQFDTYQNYVGAIAQHTAVHVGRAAEALAALIDNPDLRRRMGEAGRARVASFCDWPVVARQIRGLIDELAAVRAASPGPAPLPVTDPVSGDPFTDFDAFPTHVLRLDARLSVRPGIGEADLARAGELILDKAFGAWRAGPEEHAEILRRLTAEGPLSVRDILVSFPGSKRRNVHMSLAWMAKLGMLDWLS
ncbi:MAG TPA: glycosyltransferase family 4 protein [Phenylobacterium sp.]|nr:glycosyltransferase family 4 protein [Phenylobacterium sp.]